MVLATRKLLTPRSWTRGRSNAWDDTAPEGYEEGASGGENRMPPDTPSSPPVADADDLLPPLERERDEYLDLAKRTKADFENFRKRVARQAAEAEIRGRGELATSISCPCSTTSSGRWLLPTPRRTTSPTACGSSARSWSPCLRRAGVESYAPEGEAFDPDWHEAMLTRPGEAGQVLEVLEKGYRLNGQVLRPARVVVGAAEE